MFQATHISNRSFRSVFSSCFTLLLSRVKHSDFVVLLLCVTLTIILFMGRDTKKKKKKQDNDAETCLVEDEKVQTALCELTSKQTSELH